MSFYGSTQHSNYNNTPTTQKYRNLPYVQSPLLARIAACFVLYTKVPLQHAINKLSPALPFARPCMYLTHPIPPPSGYRKQTGDWSPCPSLRAPKNF